MINVKMDNEGLSELMCLESPVILPEVPSSMEYMNLRPRAFYYLFSRRIRVTTVLENRKKGKHEDDIDKTFETIRELITTSDSVKRQIKTNTPLCGYLSGGLRIQALLPPLSAATRNCCTAMCLQYMVCGL